MADRPLGQYPGAHYLLEQRAALRLIPPMALPLGRNALLRIVPFAVFMLLLALRGATLDAGVARGWALDLRRCRAGRGRLLAVFWREYGELARQNWPSPPDLALAAGVGLKVSALWIHLDAPWMTIGQPAATFVPLDAKDAWTCRWWPCAGSARPSWCR